MLNLQLLKRLPTDVFNTHILPFTYKTKPKSLLMDIRSYKTDYSFLQNVYVYDYNELILIYDLTKFCNDDIAPIYGIEPSYADILRRSVILSGSTDDELLKFVFGKFNRNITRSPERISRVLWGLLTPQERTSFINKYCISHFE